MERKTYTYTDANGNTIQVPVKVNKKLKDKSKKSGLGKKIATTALILSIGAGTVLGGQALWNHFHNAPETTTIVQEYQTENNAVKESLRFNPNTRASLVDQAAFLIEDAARAGKSLDAEDAVLAVIVANSNEMTPGFMGELFGERKDQTYTYAQLVDSYLRVGMMEVENMSIAKNDDRAFNTESIFANKEDYAYLSNIRQLVTRFNNSTDDNEKKQIAGELNQLALDLCTYEAYDISSPAGVLSMLSLDGMRLQTITNSNYTVLPDDIRDEMFGDGDYGCRTDATFTSNDGQVLQTHYSYRVNDLKLDSVKGKLDNAILEEGKTPILDSVISEVRERTKNVQVADINIAEEINQQAEANRDIPYAYETTPGQEKPNYSPITGDEHIETNSKGEEVVVVQDNTSKPSNEKTEAEAQKELQQKQEQAQAEADRGAADGKYDGERGLPRRSTRGKSEHYTNAYNASYDAYKALYDAEQNKVTEEFVPTVTKEEETSIVYEKPTTDNSYETVVEEEFIPLDGLTAEQLQELKEAAEGNEPIYIEDGKIK